MIFWPQWNQHENSVQNTNAGPGAIHFPKPKSHRTLQEVPWTYFMEHLPLERLTIKDGKIYELYNGKLSNPFMGVSQMQVAKKLAVKERDQHQCEFGFELSSPADPVWVQMFMADLGKISVEFQGDRMLLTCLPSDLEQNYRQIKDSMTKTNARYAKERQELVAKIAAKDEALNSARKTQEDRTTALKDQFDRLKL
jgi:hypothetical protein